MIHHLHAYRGFAGLRDMQPIPCLRYLFNSLYRNGIAIARLNGLSDDLGLRNI